jgi:hydroxypyruvate isomerase
MGTINHSVCRWPFQHLTLDRFCELIKEIGFNAIDLVGPADWRVLKKHGVYSSMCNGAEIDLEKGWCDRQYHPMLIENYLGHISLLADADYQNLICFSGNGQGLSPEAGLKNCADGIKRILAFAEKKKVVVQMELLNSKIDHPGYMCDNTAWGIELCKMISSDNFKLLFDIYHMQIMEGDLIRTIQNNFQYFGHYHTAGNPGRGSIGNEQEINYSAVCRAIAATGFKGFIAQEFVVGMQDSIGALRDGVEICSV